MNAAMTHRGPDDDGVVVPDDSGVALGARRLSVIDVAGGHQPLSNEDGTVWAVLNGEIYNYPRLRAHLLDRGHTLATHCDTESLVHLYEEYGVDLVHSLEGMYAFAIWDSQHGELVLARDRFGEKPLFYAIQDGVLTFASELGVLRAGCGVGPVCPSAMASLLTLGYVAGTRTMSRAVQQLPAAHVLRWSQAQHQASVFGYWSMPAPAPHPQAPMTELVDEAEDLLDRSVAARLVADVPVGVLLSGGLDSTLVASIARRHTTDLKTFTVAYDTGSVNEDVPARATAALLGSDHHELMLTSAWIGEHLPGLLTAIDQPIADPALVALAAISRLAREHVTVAVGGEGADELFFGYPRYRWLTRAGALDRYAPTRARAAAAATAGAVLRAQRARRIADVLRPGEAAWRNLRWITDGRLTPRPDLLGPALTDGGQVGVICDEILAAWPKSGDHAQDASRTDQRYYLCDDILQKADRASMSTSLEMRTPYLDRTLAEFAAAVPAHVHMQGGGKYLLREVLRRALPAAGTGRAKTAFRVPLADWLRGPLAGFATDHLLEGRLISDGWAQRAGCTSRLARLNDGDDSAAGELWPLVCAGAWLDSQ